MARVGNVLYNKKYIMHYLCVRVFVADKHKLTYT